MTEQKLITQVREIIHQIGGIIDEEPSFTDVEFSIRFSYNKKGIQILKNKRYKFLQIDTTTVLKENQIRKFIELDNELKIMFKGKINKIVSKKEIEYIMNFNYRPYSISLVEKYFLDGKIIDVNIIYKKVRKLFMCINLINQFLYEFFKQNDLGIIVG